MLATQMAPSLGQSIGPSSNTIQRDVREILSGGQYYVTPELGRELRSIDKGINHINLDNAFLQSSRSWGNRFDQGQLMAEKQGAAATMDKGTSMFTDIKNHSMSRNVGQMRDNQSREVHHWSVQNLKDLKSDMNPYASASEDRIRQYCDNLGVTDRYTGYRHNLNRGQRDPNRLGRSWTSQAPNARNNTLNVGWKPTNTRTLATTAQMMGVPPTYTAEQTLGIGPALPRTCASAPAVSFDFRQSTGTLTRPTSQYLPGRDVKAGPTKSIQEQCGINMTFPGRTEYMRRYTTPINNNTTGFKINPSPDFYMHGRDLMHLHPLGKCTEYQARYAWPNGDRIPRMPWLRK